MTKDQAVEAAQRIANEAGENCYIAECEIYARSHDEYGEGPYIVGIKAVFAIMFDKLTAFGGKLVGVIGPGDENVFWGDMEHALENLGEVLAQAGKRRKGRK